MRGSGLENHIKRRGKSVHSKVASLSSRDLGNVFYLSSMSVKISGKNPRHRSFPP